jgi:hypothetical protein
MANTLAYSASVIDNLKSSIVLVPGHRQVIIHNSTNVGAGIALAVITRTSAIIKIMEHASVVANLMSHDLKVNIIPVIGKFWQLPK